MLLMQPPLVSSRFHSLYYIPRRHHRFFQRPISAFSATASCSPSSYFSSWNGLDASEKEEEEEEELSTLVRRRYDFSPLLKFLSRFGPVELVLDSVNLEPLPAVSLDPVEFELAESYKAVPAPYWHSLLKSLCSSRSSLGLAYAVVSWLERHNLCFSYELLYSILIHALGRSEKLYEAFLLSQKQTLTPLTYNALIGACARNNDIDKALNLISRMRQDGYQSDFVNYSLVIQALTRSNKIDSALLQSLYREIKHDKLELDVQLVNDLIMGFAKSGDPSRALQLLGMAQSTGLSAKTATLVSIISALANSGRTVEAEALFEELRPGPISSRFLLASSRSNRFAKPRKSIINRRRRPANVSAAVVDITTKDLYDRIEFKDVDGGPWKQGWQVTYRGDEWEREKLKIFVVPHSHNDPGWKLTVEEYYQLQSRHILDTIVETLSKDSRRRFIWEEMSYLERWWRDASPSKQEALSSLVKNGQLEIVGGGWVMNDEANSHYFAIIEQIAEGNMWLNDTIGVIPKNSWAIDPFGYSSTMAYLLRRMGFENMLIQRTHYELKKELALHKNLEYIWRQSWDAMETTDIFVHMMPFYSYDIPHTCGPEPAVCCQFDFARKRGFKYELCPWGKHPVETTQDNVQERASKLLDQYRKKSTLYRTNTLLIPLGDDFRFISMDEAEAQFRNYQMLFDHINSDPSLNAEAKFGTLDDYFRTLREEADRVNYSLPGEVGSGQVVGFPSLSGDFFTYADRQQDYWSGYYVSRPFFKAVDRVLEHTLRGAEIMMSFLLGYCHRVQCEKFPTSFAYKLTAARRNLALFQHHDGVTGTAKDHVVQDYGSRMHTSLQDLQIFMSKAIEILLGIRHEKEKSDQSPSFLEAEQVRSKYDAQPVHKPIAAREGHLHTVILFNPSEQTREEVVTVVVNRAEISVLDSNWTCVPSQISPEVQHDKTKLFTGRHRLYWKASIPALGLRTYYIANGNVECEKATKSKLKYASEFDSFPCPSPYSCSKLDSEVTEIRNEHQTLVFDVKNSLLQKIVHRNRQETVVREEIGMYSSPGSGAYLFKPNGEAQPIVQSGGHLVISEGLLVQEVFSYPKTRWEKSPISHSTRVYTGGNTLQDLVVEMEYHVELLGEDFNDQELIVRYKTDIDNKKIFYSDLNGFQMSRRETYDKIPVQGNYYPMPSLAFIQGSSGQRFSVHSRQSLGVASLEDGWLEIMLDRRLFRDDGRGLGQGVMDNRAMTVVFHLLVDFNMSQADSVSNANPMNPSLLSHLVGAHLNHPINTFIAKKPQDISVRVPQYGSFAPLAKPLPCDLHIVNFKVPRPSKYSQPLEEDNPRFALILNRRAYDKAYCHKGRRANCTSVADEPVNFSNIFKDLVATKVKPTSLNLLQEDMEILGYDEQEPPLDGSQGRVSISPMEIRAYKLELRPHK